MVNMLIVNYSKAPVKAGVAPLQTTAQPVSPTPILPQPPKHKQQASVAVSVIAVIFFLSLSIGVVVFTNAKENKN